MANHLSNGGQLSALKCTPQNVSRILGKAGFSKARKIRRLHVGGFKCAELGGGRVGCMVSSRGAGEDRLKMLAEYRAALPMFKTALHEGDFGSKWIEVEPRT